MELALTQGWRKIWVEADSKAAVQAVGANKLPWDMIGRWKKVLNNIENFRISSIWREANFAADRAAKEGSKLPVGQKQWVIGRPPWLRRWENPDATYYRFC
ncbi:hypothetical protein ACHQM5_015688 [Ranunculus cassubicifolius]